MRTDTHSPKNIKPEDYTLKGFIINVNLDPYSESDMYKAEMIEMRIDDVMEANGIGGEMLERVPEPAFNGNHHNKGTCDHCGAHIIYKAVFLHLPTGEHVVTGLDCATNSLPMTNFNFMKKQLAKVVKAKKTKIQGDKNVKKWLLDNVNFSWIEDDVKWSNILVGVRKYGDVTPRQRELLTELTERRNAPPPFVCPCDKGKGVELSVIPIKNKERFTVTGVVRGIKFVDDNYSYNQFATIKKLLVVSGEVKVWVTCPSNIYDVLRGDCIKFDAALEYKDTDFAIAKRPTKADHIYRNVMSH